MTLADRIAVFMDGRIAQVGTPREVFAQPRTVDVAGFIGTPPMNLLPARWEAATLTIGTDRLAVAARTEAPRDVTVGVRPGDVRIGATGLAARVERIEDLGDTAIISFTAGSRLIKQKADRAPDVREGESVRLSFAAEAAHLFDRATGARL